MHNPVGLSRAPLLTALPHAMPRVQWRSVRHTLGQAALSLSGLGVVLALWQLVTSLQLYPAFLIPAPLTVVERFIAYTGEGRLWPHVWATGSQVIIGLLIGVNVGALLGYMLAKSRLLNRALSPLIAAVQAVPVVAYAPLLIIWFGSGAESKIITCALTVFFPMMTNTLVGLRGVPLPLRDLMRSLEATRWQMFTRLELPSALPVLLGGLKVAAALSVIGVVIGEFVSADAGLGWLIRYARQAYDTPLVFVAVFMLALMARLLYGAVSLLETWALRWQRAARRV